jgi:hypothetical protein
MQWLKRPSTHNCSLTTPEQCVEQHIRKWLSTSSANAYVADKDIDWLANLSNLHGLPFDLLWEYQVSNPTYYHLLVKY